MKFYAAEPNPHLDGRQAFYLHGQCVGGGSSFNRECLCTSSEYGMSTYNTSVTMYSRAAASDYDDWKTKYGAEGWAFKDLLPYLKKVRTLLFVR